MSKKLAFISDIHGNLLALQAVLKKLEDLKISRQDTYGLGDLIGYGPRPNEVLDCMKEENIFSILGNYDEAVGFYLPTCGCKSDSEKDKLRSQNSLGWTAKQVLEENKEYLRDLEESHEIELEGVTIYLTHGSPFSINEYVYEEDEEKHADIFEEISADVIVIGHTHCPYIRKYGEKLLVNPGSVGRPKDGDNRAALCIMDIDGRREPKVIAEVIRVEYDFNRVADEIRASELLDEFAQHIESGYVD